MKNSELGLPNYTSRSKFVTSFSGGARSIEKITE
jgi:hypothetical protein